MIRHRIAALSLLLLGSSLATVARADATNDEKAEKLFNEAVALASAQNYTEACPKFELSQKLDPALGTQFNLADCYEHTGRKASARRLFLEVATAARAAGKAAREKSARDRAAALEGGVAKLTILVPHADPALAITIDGAAFAASEWNKPAPVDAGPHVVVASAPGKKNFESKVASTDGATIELPIPALEAIPVVVAREPAKPIAVAQPRPEGSGRRTAAYVIGGVGAAGLLVGSGAGVFSILKHGDAVKNCPNHDAPCADPDARASWKTATDAGNVSTVAFVVGGVVTTAAIVLWVTAPKNSTSAATWQLAPAVGAHYLGMFATGRF